MNKAAIEHVIADREREGLELTGEVSLKEFDNEEKLSILEFAHLSISLVDAGERVGTVSSFLGRSVFPIDILERCREYLLQEGIDTFALPIEAVLVEESNALHHIVKCQ